MDACFGLVHKNHSGSSSFPPLFSTGNGYFVNYSEVEKFVDAYKHDNIKDKVKTDRFVINFLAHNSVINQLYSAVYCM